MSTIIPISAYGPGPVNITKKEEKYIDSTFKQELKRDRQKSTVRRNDDNGYGAALTCLARDMVTATPEEATLIAAKMNFIQNLVNQNLQTDANIRTQKNSDSRAMIETKSDAYAKKAPCQAELMRTASSSLSDVTNSVEKIASSFSVLK